MAQRGYNLPAGWAYYIQTSERSTSMEPNWLKGPLPFELGMALVENPAALEKYASLGREDKQRFIDNAGCTGSRSQMQAYVQKFMSG